MMKLTILMKTLNQNFDFSKSFDCLSHDLLIAKLAASGFNSESLEFINSYLSQGKQRAKVNNSYSSYIKIDFGVPQGSIFGPLLINIYICDMFYLSVLS